MSIEVSPTSKLIPAEATAQGRKSTHEEPLSNLAGGLVEGSVIAKESQRDQDVRNNPAQSTRKDKLPSVSVASETRRRPASANPATDPLRNLVSVDQVNKRTLGIAMKPKGVPNLNEEEKTVDVGNPEELQHESVLAGEIKALWSSQKFRSLSLRRSRRELEELRTSLSKRLYNLKHLLVRTGREGKWTDFLRQQNIPRTTADRYVDKWKRSILPDLEKRTNGAISELTKEEIVEMVKKLKPKLVRQLTTPDSVNLFIAELGAALELPVPVV